MPMILDRLYSVQRSRRGALGFQLGRVRMLALLVLLTVVLALLVAAASRGLAIESVPVFLASDGTYDVCSGVLAGC